MYKGFILFFSIANRAAVLYNDNIRCIYHAAISISQEKKASYLQLKEGFIRLFT